MPKSSKTQIDKDEKKLLMTIQENSGDTIDEIAKKCGWSRQKVWRMKKRLEENKTIWGYNTIVDDEKIDKQRFVLLMKKSPQPMGENINKIIDLTAQKKSEKFGINIITGGLLHGNYDFIVIFSADDIRSAKKLKEILLQEYPKMLSEIEILEFIFPLKIGGIVNPEIDKIKEFF